MFESNLSCNIFLSARSNLFYAATFFISVGLLSLLYTPARAQDENLKIAVAANLLLPMQDIKKLYEQNYGSTLTLIPGSSGKLTAQILNGAPYDVFLAADMEFPEKIRREGHAVNSPEVLLRGKLVFWSKQQPDKPLGAWLGEQDIRSLAIAQPELAPYGERSKDWLSELGIYEELLPNVVFGESIGQVNQYIRSATVDAALTAISAMHAKELKDLGYWEPLEIYSGESSRLDHGLVLLSNTTTDKLIVNQFVEFIKSPIAEKVFLDYGYEIP